MLKYLLQKEIKQILRNPFLPRLISAYPFVLMLLFPRVANLEVNNINLCVIDGDHSIYSTRLTQKISATRNFHLSVAANTYAEAMESIKNGKSDAILEIPNGFEKEVLTNRLSQVMISANSVNGTKGAFATQYLARIIDGFSEEIGVEIFKKEPNEAGVNIIPRFLYNPYLDYKSFIIPALTVILLMMICGFLPALNIVSEKEKGTIEQINVTPIREFVFILSKLIPYWIIGIFIITVCFGLAALIYGLFPAGNLLTIYFFSLLFVFIFSGLGLVISNYSATMQQAMFIMFFFAIVMMLMSGIFTPTRSMPDWAQAITLFNPIKYFVEVMRAVYLKGSKIGALQTQLSAMLGFAVIFNIWAVASYKKTAF